MGASPVATSAEQFLHGYSDGHRLLAASTSLPPEEARRLLIQSDAPASSPEHRLLSSLPMPQIGRWALTATWAAPEMPRPGSVWSHTILLDESNLRSLCSARPILTALRRPVDATDLAPYRERLVLAEDCYVAPTNASEDILMAVALSFYGWPGEPVALITHELADAEDGLLSLWAQQWAALRAQASFATRGRVGPSTTASIQLASRPGRSHEPEIIVLRPGHEPLPSGPPWLAPLIGDAREPGALRDFLRHFGEEAPGGYRDVPVLVRIFSALSLRPASPEAISELARSYPQKGQMARLKRACLSSAGESWSAARETDKVLATIANHTAVKWQDLDIARRVVALADEDILAFEDALLTAWRTGDGALRDAVVEAVEESSVVDTAVLRSIADEDPALAARLAAKAPAVLYDTDLWEAGDDRRVSLLEALAWEFRSGVDQRLAGVLVGSGNHELISAARGLGLVTPRALAKAVAERGATVEGLEHLEQLPPADRDAVVRDSLKSRNWVVLMLAAASSSPHANDVVDTAGPTLRAHLWEADEFVREIVAARLLARARGRSRPAALRDTFGIVHNALISQHLRDDVGQSLDEVLPAGKDQDRAERLRMHLSELIERDEWSSAQISKALRGAGTKADLLVDLLPKKSDARKAVQQALKKADLNGTSQ